VSVFFFGRSQFGCPVFPDGQPIWVETRVKDTVWSDRRFQPATSRRFTDFFLPIRVILKCPWVDAGSIDYWSFPSAAGAAVSLYTSDDQLSPPGAVAVDVSPCICVGSRSRRRRRPSSHLRPMFLPCNHDPTHTRKPLHAHFRSLRRNKPSCPSSDKSSLRWRARSSRSRVRSFKLRRVGRIVYVPVCWLLGVGEILNA
jgi:hypothetical protein